MKVCYFGTYEKNNQFNRTIINSLKKNGIDVIEAHIPFIDNMEDKSDIFKNKLSLIFRLINAYLIALTKFNLKQYDVIIVGYVGHYDILLAKILCLLNNRPLVFAPMLSLYDTFVEDRKKISKNSLLGKIMFNLDKYACKFSDLIFLDTNAHIDYFNKEFNVPVKKFQRVWLGTNEDVFGNIKIEPKKNEKFTVLHFGKYIPLHGMPYIIDAIELLKDKDDIEFILIGSGQLYNEIKEKVDLLNLKNVKIIAFIPQTELISYIINADVCLGIFGVTMKSSRVIPTKIYDSIILSKPVITRNSPAIREAFTHEKNIYLCKEGSGEEIAKSIIYLKNNPQIKLKIAQGAKKLYQENFAWDVQGKAIKAYLDGIAKK